MNGSSRVFEKSHSAPISLGCRNIDRFIHRLTPRKLLPLPHSAQRSSVLSMKLDCDLLETHLGGVEHVMPFATSRISLSTSVLLTFFDKRASSLMIWQHSVMPRRPKMEQLTHGLVVLQPGASLVRIVTVCRAGRIRRRAWQDNRPCLLLGSACGPQALRWPSWR